MTAFDEFEDYDAVGLATLIREGAVTAAEVMEAAIARCEARNPALNAVVLELYDHGRAAVAGDLPDGPLAGVPYLIKDLGATLAGTPTTGGSKFMADVVPDADSETVTRLKAAGMAIFGKTNTCEFGMSITCEPQLYGPTRNPWDDAVTPGGSSGGAASAVAARILPAAHASDGFGSIRVPASCCGLVGMKPTRGRNSFSPGLGERMGGIVAEHTVSISVRDHAAILDATAGPAPGDPYFAPPPARPFLDEVGVDPGKLRVGFSYGGATGARTDGEHTRVLDETLSVLEGLGHDVVEADPPIDNGEMQEIFRTLMASNAAQTIRLHPTKGRLPEPGEVENVVAATAEMGERVTGYDVFLAQGRMHQAGRRMAAFHEDYDVLLTPGLGHMPPKLGWIDMMMDDADEYWDRVAAFSPFTVWFNLTGQPAISLPVGTTDEGFPVSVQAVGRFADEATLFRLSAQLETAMPWRDRKPAGLPAV
ncbi:MAG: amidase [Rhodospirillaceae bacterium]|nr:amidase [Rhodospirillaceae bacterium]MBT3929473.1 amidase [Rhodospirillaceae bacterium]MBT4773446.1 amidase [Rhodospirillaceae bacterium]MBT5359938.1 amidase [Rhodospirillaceae bacterium]MBT5769419.1 amidase [Rhodospirillaceae bacterium]